MTTWASRQGGEAGTYTVRDMLEQLPDLPPGVIGFEAVGEIHADDYREVLHPAIDAAATTGSIRFVYVLGDRFEGYTSGASWEDAKLGSDHLGAWQRTALVTDVDWLTHLASLFGWMMPGHFRRFPVAELDAAITWAATDD